MIENMNIFVLALFLITAYQSILLYCLTKDVRFDLERTHKVVVASLDHLVKIHEGAYLNSRRVEIEIEKLSLLAKDLKDEHFLLRCKIDELKETLSGGASKTTS